MKKRLLPLLLVLVLCLQLVIPVGATTTPAVQGVYDAGVVTVTGTNFAMKTAYSMIAVKDGEDNLIALGYGTSTMSGALETAITTGELESPADCTVYVYDNNGGAVVASGTVANVDSSPDTKPDTTPDTGTAPETKPEVTPDEEEEELTDGTYSVPVTVKKYQYKVGGYTASSENSMANDAVVGTAMAKLKGDEITYTIQFTALDLYGLHGHLLKMWYYDKDDVKDGSLDDPMPMKVESYYEDIGLYGDVETFPETVSFTYEGTTEDVVYVMAEVDAMSDVGNQNAVLLFDWDKAKKDGGASAGGDSGGVDSDEKTEAEEDEVETEVFSSGESLSSDVLEEIRDRGAQLVVENEEGVSLQFSDEALSALVEAVGSHAVEIQLGQVDVSSLNEAQQAIVGDRPVFSFTAMVNGEAITHFDGGEVAVTLPYTLGEDENPLALVIYYVDEDGNVEHFTCVYDAEKETIAFVTTHFSYYAIGYDESRVFSAMFADVDHDAWYYEAVAYVVGNGLFNGVSANQFAPDALMTRAMVFTVLHRMSGDETQGGGEDWHVDGVNWSTQNGITDGSNLFSYMSKEQLATTFYRYANLVGADTSHQLDLSDYDNHHQVSHWALEPKSWALATGVLENPEAGALNPTGSATRAEVAAMIMRLAETV